MEKESKCQLHFAFSKINLKEWQTFSSGFINSDFVFQTATLLKKKAKEKCLWMNHSKVKYKNLQHETNKQIFPKQKFLQSMLFSYRNIKKTYRNNTQASLLLHHRLRNIIEIKAFSRRYKSSVLHDERTQRFLPDDEFWPWVLNRVPLTHAVADCGQLEHWRSFYTPQDQRGNIYSCPHHSSEDTFSSFPSTIPIISLWALPPLIFYYFILSLCALVNFFLWAVFITMALSALGCGQAQDFIGS